MAGIYLNFENTKAHFRARPPNSSAVQQFVTAFNAEISSYAASHGQNETIESIYLGGEFHHLPVEALCHIVESLFAHFDTTNIHEIAADLEPDAVQEPLLLNLQALGFTRLNLLARSFFDDDLRYLGCTYQSKDVHSAIEDIQALDRIEAALELAYDIAPQPFEYWAANLEKVAHRGIEHLSLRDSRQNGIVELPRQMACCFSFPELEDRFLERAAFAMEYLPQHDYDQYLILEFARPGAQCDHYLMHVYQSNLLGLGPGAHSFWWHGTSHSRAHRWSNVDNISQYIALLKQRELPVDTRSAFDLDSLANDYMMLSIQTAGGINTEKLETEYGVDLYSEKITTLARLEREGWIEPIRNNRIILTDTGRLNCYHILPELVLDI